MFAPILKLDGNVTTGYLFSVENLTMRLFKAYLNTAGTDKPFNPNITQIKPKCAK